MSEQPKPKPNDREWIFQRIMRKIAERAGQGLSRYGTYLQAHNGRDSLRDAQEEALDLCHYLEQAMIERDALVAKLAAQCWRPIEEAPEGVWLKVGAWRFMPNTGRQEWIVEDDCYLKAGGIHAKCSHYYIQPGPPARPE